MGGTTRTALSTSWPYAGSASSDGPLGWTGRTLQARRPPWRRPPCQGTIRCPPSPAPSPATTRWLQRWRPQPRPHFGWGCRHHRHHSSSSSSSCSYFSSWRPRYLLASALDRALARHRPSLIFIGRPRRRHCAGAKNERKMKAASVSLRFIQRQVWPRDDASLHGVSGCWSAASPCSSTRAGAARAGSC